MNKTIIILLSFFITSTLSAQETLFADYFDIKVGEKSGAIVLGKVHLKKNKDIYTEKIPKDYQFYITETDTDKFEIQTSFDSQGRIFGVIKVAKRKKTGKIPVDHHLVISLKEGKKVLTSKKITIHVVEKTMWEDFVTYYTPKTLSNKRLYGKKFKNDKLSNLITLLERTNGQFSFTTMYGKHPSEYKSGKELENDWRNVADHIGGLGYAYAKSKKFGLPSGDPEKIERLKRVIYKAIIQYTNSVPVEPNDVMIEGKPIGTELGDGFSMLGEYKFAGHGFVTHHWRTTDALAAPLIHIWPEVLKGIENGDEEAQEVYNSIIRFYQLFFAVVPGRRSMDDPTERWKNISDVNYSEGAWSDANISHRMRSLMMMPILWADYNRPITYVPYWYDDYYNGTKFEGMTFADNWSPRGVVLDLRNWCDKLSLPTHLYDQSGFHPDGTISHHTGHNSSDSAMFAYGFEWLVTVNDAIEYYKNTPYPLKDENYQFLADRIGYTYRRMIYKDHLDFVVAGRSFSSDVSDFGSGHVAREIKQVLAGKSPTTKIEGEKELKELKKAFKNKTHKFSGTTSFWNADYLVHRKEEDDINYYFSVKHKSVRTSGAEDFTKVRKSWHAGSGVFQLRVNGNEYSPDVLSHMDWHVLPGVTEAWKTNPMPKGPASASMPGGNAFSGILSDGTYGLTGYHHKPIDKYTAAEALKSYHLIDGFGTAIGSHIKRKEQAKGEDLIVTCVDQSRFTSAITYGIDGKITSIQAGESVSIEKEIKNPVWIHHNNKGYLIYPKQGQKLFIKTGTEINVTETDLNIEKNDNYIIAIDHGVNPETTEKDKYHYVLVANVSVEDMPEILTEYTGNTATYASDGIYHALCHSLESLTQVVFYEAGKAILDDQWVETDKPALVMLKDLGTQLRLSVVDPMHSLDNEVLILKISQSLKAGTYHYTMPGIKPRKGEKAIVTSTTEGSVITISLPDKADGVYYNYQEQMYAGAPIVLMLEKK
ncbi:polysaccharide lyase family 8 super-sandwich domain-containing protein [Flavivirga spongiicola]|uniref:Polysaccharide lyase beta-sandwich domain-containing protein n=1 Tax=Flavivirga spongiicola TaxID=421621 RepID=A0ABU7XW76_9FLAO|nr:polysaccharide lyase family 8 super-sandwich domain-containing protein [Flavivirga sp. MEBiC05379]MDO5980031.1 polysaccharide lyase family 8 super-sandwich domain-containing protein [Flavivirga sp. MEBiC05379]